MHDVDGFLWCRDAWFGIAERAFGMSLADAQIVASELRRVADAIDAWPTIRRVQIAADERELRDVEGGA